MNSNANSCEIRRGTLRLASTIVLEDLSPEWTLVEDRTQVGAFLKMRCAEAACFLEAPVGRVRNMKRFTSFHRFSPFWTKSANRHIKAEVRPETLRLLAETEDGHCIMIVPLLDSTARYSLRGSNDSLMIVSEEDISQARQAD